MTQQEWRPVVGYEGYYEVSSDGKVRSIDRVTTAKDGRVRKWRGKELSQKQWRGSYWKVGLCKNSVHLVWSVHRLVCDAFHGPSTPEAPVVRHLNGDGLDNRAENLTWGTHAENTADMVRHGRAYWLNQTHCIHGHEFNEKNTRLTITAKGGQKRECRECQRIRSIPKNRERDRKRAEASRRLLICQVCEKSFYTQYGQTKNCSVECKKRSRRKDFLELKGLPARRSA